MRILRPIEFDLARQERLFFLLGPIQGGGNWQERACAILDVLTPEATIAVPCRWESDHPLKSRFAKGARPNDFSDQTTWERYYLEEAARSDKNGCILAWLPCEDPFNPRSDGQPYARDSYGEIGEWRGRMMSAKHTRFVMGAEERFPGLSVMQKNWNAALKMDFVIFPTLEETVRQAVERSES
ncbi:MAG: hypothetical protein V4465_02520 [Patescibacteria group bacterium]